MNFRLPGHVCVMYAYSGELGYCHHVVFMGFETSKQRQRAVLLGSVPLIFSIVSMLFSDRDSNEISHLPLNSDTVSGSLKEELAKIRPVYS